MKGQVKQTTLCYLEQDEKYLMLFKKNLIFLKIFHKI